MRLNRRQLLSIGGTSWIALISGCTALGPAHEVGTPTSKPSVEIRLRGPDEDRVLFTQTDVETVGEIQVQNGTVSLPVTLSDEGVAQVSDIFESADVDDRPEAFKVVVVHRKQELSGFGISPDFANVTASGDWNGKFRMTFENRSNAETIRIALVG